MPAGVLLLGTVIFCWYRFVFCAPQARLTRGLVRLAGEMQSAGEKKVDDAGLAALLRQLQEENAFSVYAWLNVTIPGVNTVGVDYTQLFDGNEEQMGAGLVFSYYNIPVLKVKTAADADRFYLFIPDLLDRWYCIHTRTLGADYQNSVWKVFLGDKLSEDFGFSLFEKKGENTGEAAEEQTGFGGEEWITLLEEYLPKFMGSITVEENNDTVLVERGDTQIACEGIRVVIEKEVINDFFQDFAELCREEGMQEIPSGKELQRDLELCFYLDKKDNIVRISTPRAIRFSEGEIEKADFAISFAGEENSLDVIKGEGIIEVAGNVLTFAVENSVEKEREGAYTDRLKIEKITVQKDDEEKIKITGEIEIGMLTEEIDMPAEAQDIMKIEFTALEAFLEKLTSVIR